MARRDNPPLPQQRENLELLTRARAGDQQARERLVELNLPLVSKVAARFAGVDQMEDLCQVGAIGLLKAIDQFDPGRGVSFSTYAVPKILGEIRMYLRSNNPVKVSRQTLKLCGDIKRCRQRLEQQLGRQPTVAEVARVLAVSVEEVAAAETATAAPLGLEQVNASEEVDDIRVALKDVIRRLEARERQVIALRYFAELSQSQVAEKLGLSQGHVSRIEKGVLEKLRAAMG